MRLDGHLRRGLGLGSVLALGVLVCHPAAHSLAIEEKNEGCRFTAYAPEWTWQKRDINILLMLENTGDTPVEKRVTLYFPEGAREHFDYAGPEFIEMIAAPGEVARACFKAITPRADAPPQHYEFTLELSSAEGGRRVAYPVKTVRGAVVNPGQWALYLPAGLALLWCGVFALALRAMAARGAWKEPGPAIARLPNTPAWVADRPGEEKA